MAEIQATGRRASAAAGRAASDWRPTLARVGLATMGVLYVVTGLLVIQVARGKVTTDEADQRGAIERVVETTGGRWLLLVLTVGLFALVLWRAVQAVTGDPVEGDDAKDRIEYAAKAVVYLVLAIAALRVLIDNWSASGAQQAEAGGANQEQQAAATVLEWPAGWLLVIAVGIASIVYGAFQLWAKAVKAGFMKRLDTASMDARTEQGVRTAGRAGYAAKGVLAILAGVFFVVAGATHDSSEAKGLSGLLQELREASWGPPVLWAVAIGLFAYGLFRLAESRYHRGT